VVSLSNVFPNPADPQLGLFVRRRLRQLAELSGEVEIRVVAPIPIFDYAGRHTRLFRWRTAPARRDDGPLEIFHPHWFYPPLGGASNAVWLHARLDPFLAQLRRSFRFDLIDAHFGHPDGVAAAMLAGRFGCPFLVTLRGSEPAHAGESPLRDRAMGWALRRAARVIAVSERLRQFAIDRGTPSGRTRTIPNGIDGTVFYPRDYEECRRKHGIGPEALVLLSAGYLVERKGHHRAIAALERVRRAGVDAQLLIAGGPGPEGDMEREIRQEIVRRGLDPAVRMLGPVDANTLAELMSAADVFVLASSQEGWPNVVHEAMGCGTPVVATDVGAIPQMISSSELGSVVAYGDQQALAGALIQALRTEWNSSHISSWAHARSWATVAREVLAEMRAAVGEEQSGQAQ
jgi:glycosyltransferase involved in cell wall biosynthesis